MRHDNDIEQFLCEMPGPRVVAGSHRARLWEELRNSKCEEQPSMMRVTLKRTIVFCCAVAMLVGTGWGAYEACCKIFWIDSHTAVSSNDPNFTQEDANQLHAMVQRAIAAGNYTLVRSEEIEYAPGEKTQCYVYKVLLENGNTESYGTSEPLPEPAK